MRKSCASCGQEFEAKRAAAKTCSERCKKRAQRSPQAESSVVPMERPAESTGRLEQAATAELESAGRLRSASGEAALALARRVDASQGETGSGVASLVREYRAAMAEALKDAETESDPLDEIRLRRERKLASG